MAVSPPKTHQAQISFFGYLFGDQEGFLCLATIDPSLNKTNPKRFKDYFFNWPEQKDEISHWLESETFRMNVYFCTSLLSEPIRKKQYCLPNNLVWSDLDHCDPDIVRPVPSLLLKSSEGKYQAIWRVDRELAAYEQEDFSKKIAYTYASEGADKSGWDLTQLLRVPFTYNYKYEKNGQEPPQIDIIQAYDILVPVELFQELEVQSEDYAPSPTARAAESLPDVDRLPSIEQITYRHITKLEGTGWRSIFGAVPEADENWSAILWKFLNMSFEIGMDKYEVYAVAREAGCNKYARDGRSDVDLWADVLRAEAAQHKASLAFGHRALLEMPDIVQGEVPEIKTFIDDYYDWAVTATDAVPAYHELCAFILISSVLSASIRLKTTYGEMYTNLWGLVLGDSTLTRKTTAMSMAMSILSEVDHDIILASDGTVEGILTGLSERPHRPSVFFRDEITGFFDAVHRKDYLAGITETFTHLYDVPKIYPRRLRKETITIKSPVFIFFGGGIRDKLYSILTDESVLSGFIPRFLVVSGESDLSRIRRTGPSTPDVLSARDALHRRVADLYERYNRSSTMRVLGQEIEMPATTFATLTDDAWQRYGDIEQLMVEAAHGSAISTVALPTFERLSRSLLKMSMLLAAVDNEAPIDKPHDLIVTDKHVSRAAIYIQKWGNYTIDLVMATGKGANERRLDAVLNTITRHPDILRGQVMRLHSLSSREMTEIQNTLEDRGYITSEKAGRGYKLRAV